MQKQPSHFKILNHRVLTILMVLGLVLSLVPTVAAKDPPMVDVIIQGRDLGLVRAATQGRGGEVTHNLGIIKAVAARVPEPALKALARHPHVERIYPNLDLELSGVGAPTVSDEFKAISYGLNEGTENWASDWNELGESDGPGGGQVRVEASSYCEADNCLRIGAHGSSIDGRGLAREADLEGAIAATLSFVYRRSLRESEYASLSTSVALADTVSVPVAGPVEESGGASVSVQISGDGGAKWATLASYSLSGSDLEPFKQSFDITGYISGNTRIRFMGSGSEAKGYLHVDDVQIAYGFSDTFFSAHVDADALHDLGIDGSGVTVAVIDSGFWAHPAILKNANGQARVLAEYDAILDQFGGAIDDNGHGSHVSSLIVSNRRSQQGKFNGLAPNADLVSIKAFGANGGGSYADVIRAIDWAVLYKDKLNIRVLNMSFSAPPQSYYWDDPLNQAVMRAWQAGRPRPDDGPGAGQRALHHHGGRLLGQRHAGR